MTIAIGLKLKHIDMPESYYIMNIEGKGEAAIVTMAYTSNSNKKPFETTMFWVNRMIGFGRWVADN